MIDKELWKIVEEIDNAHANTIIKNSGIWCYEPCVGCEAQDTLKEESNNND